MLPDITPELADQILLWIATLAPIYLVLRYNLWGVCIGGLVAWVTLIIAGIVLSELDPERGSSILDGVWILFGWVGGILYCLLILLLKWLAIAGYRLVQPHPVTKK